jgi:hypothetical protein
VRLLVLAFLSVAATASAQGTGTKTPPATKQDTKAPATKAPATKAADAKAPAAAPAGQRRPGLDIAPETASTAQLPVVMREAYDYDAAGRRDPFFSLLGTAELRPSVADLRLTSVLYHPTRPIAVMRDATTNTRYTVTVGTTLGRMRVVLIKPRVVIFTIEEFGLNRQDSLVLGDTTKARAR